VNGGGVISVLVVNGSVIQMTLITIQNISMSSTANGAVSINGNVGWLVIDYGTFNDIGTGNSGGGIYVNISEYTGSSNSAIQNCVFSFCKAAYGGALYIGSSGIFLYNNNFSNNTATTTGSDIFENKTFSQSFYNTLTIQLCCTISEGITFALGDNTNKSDLLPLCIPPSGERYVSSTNSYDTQNTCLNEDTPCETLWNAIASGEAALEDTISITVVGEYEDSSSTISEGKVVHIHGPVGSQSMK
jgi:hypothetical protein